MKVNFAFCLKTHRPTLFSTPSCRIFHLFHLRISSSRHFKPGFQKNMEYCVDAENPISYHHLIISSSHLIHLITLLLLGCKGEDGYDGPPISLKQKNRDVWRSGKPNGDSSDLYCYRGMWPRRQYWDELNNVADKQAKDCKWYYPYQEHTTPEGAKLQQDHERSRNEFKKQICLIKWGLWVAVAALVINTIALIYTVSAKPLTEKHYQQTWCDEHGRQIEVILANRIKADCMSDTNAVELDCR